MDIYWELWKYILDPIYDECMALGDPDLTTIVVSKETGHPPYFSQGGEARSVPFNDKKHLAKWTQELKRVFSTWRTRKGK